MKRARRHTKEDAASDGPSASLQGLRGLGALSALSSLSALGALSALSSLRGLDSLGGLSALAALSALTALGGLGSPTARHGSAEDGVSPAATPTASPTASTASPATATGTATGTPTVASTDEEDSATAATGGAAGRSSEGAGAAGAPGPDQPPAAKRARRAPPATEGGGGGEPGGGPSEALFAEVRAEVDKAVRTVRQIAAKFRRARGPGTVRGFVFEVHHAATFNIAAICAGSSLRAGRSGGLADIRIRSLEQPELLLAKAQLKCSGSGKANRAALQDVRYSGMLKVVPAAHEGARCLGLASVVSYGGVRSAPISVAEIGEAVAQPAAHFLGHASRLAGPGFR